MTQPSLPITRYQIRLQADTALQFPAYAGSAWRGAFGHALKRAVCITREPDCTRCLLGRSCVYSYLFETPTVQQPLLGKVGTAPHPYILHPLDTNGRQYAPGEPLTLGLTLMGRAVAHLPYIIHALQQVGGRGIGKGDGRFTLLAVGQERVLGGGAWQTVYVPGGSLQVLPTQMPARPPLAGNLRVGFHTPYRSLTGGTPVRSSRFQFRPFISGLMRRISLLQAGHADGVVGADFRRLGAQAAAIPVLGPQLEWYEWSRYSNRQQRHVQMGGLVGSFGLPLEGLEPYWPWLWLGQWAHAGKGAVMGMGGYSVSSQACEA